MKVLEIYENTVFNDRTNHGFQVISVPARSFVKSDQLEPEVINRAIGFAPICNVIASDLTWILAAILAEQPDLVRDLALSTKNDGNERNEYLFNLVRDSEPFLFAEEMVFGKHVIFEQSPISLESVGNLVRNASGIGIGAYIGLIVGENSPMLLVTVPAGMLICGSAAGVARALEEGLKIRILRLLRGDKDPEDDIKQLDLDDDKKKTA